jgi:hypothetical protein
VIRCPTLPHPNDNSRPLERQRSHCCLVILAPPALWAIKSLRPPGVLERLPSKRVARLAETGGAKPPEGRHGHVATSLDDRGHTGEGEHVLDVCIPTPIRAQRADQARGVDGTGPRSRRKHRNIRVCTGAGVNCLFNARDRFSQTANWLDQGVHEPDGGPHHRRIGGRGDRLANPRHPLLVEGARVGMMRLKERPQRGVIRLLHGFQGGPAREEVTAQWRVEGREPPEDLRAIAFEHARQPVRQAGVVVDQCPAVLDEEWARPGGLVGRTPGLQLLPLLPDQCESERGIRGIILLAAWRESFAKLGHHARINGVQDQVVIRQE